MATPSLVFVRTFIAVSNPFLRIDRRQENKLTHKNSGGLNLVPDDVQTPG